VLYDQRAQLRARRRRLRLPRAAQHP
jgi:hypothetical protein